MRIATIVICATLFALDATAEAATPPKVLLILDASGSMWGQVEGRAKIEIARELIRDEVVGKLPADMPIGLMAYGHNRKGDCGDIELLAPMGAGRETVISTVNALAPKGMTPITAALTQAGKLLRRQEGRTEIILVSDGKETCEGDPCAAAKAIREAGVKLRVHVIGFDVSPEEEAQLVCIAREGGGIYARAESAAQLREAVEEIETAIVPAPAVEKRDCPERTIMPSPTRPRKSQSKSPGLAVAHQHQASQKHTRKRTAFS
jgi:Ca-activated chloride channel family protein